MSHFIDNLELEVILAAAVVKPVSINGRPLRKEDKVPGSIGIGNCAQSCSDSKRDDTPGSSNGGSAKTYVFSRLLFQFVTKFACLLHLCLSFYVFLR